MNKMLENSTNMRKRIKLEQSSNSVVTNTFKSFETCAYTSLIYFQNEFFNFESRTKVYFQDFLISFEMCLR